MMEQKDLGITSLSEWEVQCELSSVLESDFLIQWGGEGVHLRTRKLVLPDLILIARPHLLEQGIPEGKIALEVKTFKNIQQNKYEWAPEYHRKVLVQAASYNQSIYDGVAPIFSLIYPGTSIYNNFAITESGRTTIKANAAFASELSVGDMCIYSNKWEVNFGGRLFYSSVPSYRGGIFRTGVIEVVGSQRHINWSPRE